jgi:uncharacterized Rossmann fold enzyme
MSSLSYVDNMKNILISEDDKKYQDFIKGKRVAVVGPSPYLNGKNMGKLIESYDYILRVNQCIFAANSTKNNEDYGSRTDIVYLSQRARDRFLDKFPKIFENTKYIALLCQKKQDDFPKVEFRCFVCEKVIGHGEEFCLNEDWDKPGSTPKLGHWPCVHPTVDYKSYPVPVIKRDLSDMQKNMGHSFLTGVMAVIDMIAFGASEVGIFGFDFYQKIKDSIHSKNQSTTASDLYCNGYLIFQGTMELSHKDEDGKQLLFFKQLYNRYKNIITLDDNLKQILNDNFSPRAIISKNDKEFDEYISGKSVILVGPSPNLEGKKMGSFIDNHDVVIRFNGGASLCGSNVLDYGMKTDVLYLNKQVKESLMLDISEKFKGLNVRYIVLESLASDTSISNSNNSPITCSVCDKPIENGHEFWYDTQEYKVNFKDLNANSNVNFQHYHCTEEYIDWDLVINSNIVKVNSFELSKKICEKAMIGLTALEHILSKKPKNINMIGMDFFDGIKTAKLEKLGTIHYRNLYALDCKVLDESCEALDSPRDSEGLQLKYFKQLYDKEENITIDENLQRILKLRSKS